MYFSVCSPFPFNESLEFTLKNLNDKLTISSDNIVKSTEEKLKRVEESFYKYYKFDRETEGAILEGIGKIIKKNECDPIDLPRIDRVHHLKLHIQLSYDDKLLSKADFAKFYTVLYRDMIVPYLPSYMTKYALLKFIGGRFIVFIIFDEKAIEGVYTVVAENQIDLTSPMWIEEVKINTKCFKKSKTQ